MRPLPTHPRQKKQSQAGSRVLTGWRKGEKATERREEEEGRGSRSRGPSA
jgi:hypothetical protein